MNTKKERFLLLALPLLFTFEGNLSAAEAAAPKQKTFSSPSAAADALISAAARFDVPALTEILGQDGVALVTSSDSVQDKNQAAAFARKALEKRSIVKKDASHATLLIGDEDWPTPVPIVNGPGGWRFDSKAGAKEVLYRRIGGNELDAIQVCRGFVDAQKQYATTKHDSSRVNQYAQRIIATPGKQDGLAWQNADGTWAGPVGSHIAQFIAEGYTDKMKPFHGYYYKVLKGQGPAAHLGAMDFVVEGAMIGGFALVAAPAEYRVTGVKTFIVSHDGVVYEKDLGEKTLDTFRAMERYDPDKTWHALPKD